MIEIITKEIVDRSLLPKEFQKTGGLGGEQIPTPLVKMARSSVLPQKPQTKARATTLWSTPA